MSFVRNWMERGMRRVLNPLPFYFFYSSQTHPRQRICSHIQISKYRNYPLNQCYFLSLIWGSLWSHDRLSVEMPGVFCNTFFPKPKELVLASHNALVFIYTISATWYIIIYSFEIIAGKITGLILFIKLKNPNGLTVLLERYILLIGTVQGVKHIATISILIFFNRFQHLFSFWH